MFAYFTIKKMCVWNPWNLPRYEQIRETHFEHTCILP